MIPRATADESDQKTITFSGPVEIPGQVLEAGTYVFKLADSESDRDIVQVFNKDETHLYATELAIPDERLRPAEKPIITFDEAAAGSPEAARAWFYPGETYGHDFVYPKPQALGLAEANNIPVASMSAELAENTKKPAVTMKEPHVISMSRAHLKAQKPNGEERGASRNPSNAYAAKQRRHLPTGSRIIGGTPRGITYAYSKILVL